MEIIKSIKLRQLRKERETIKANRKAWINLHKASTIDASISRTFLAYQSAINRVNASIRNLKNENQKATAKSQKMAKMEKEHY